MWFAEGKARHFLSPRGSCRVSCLVPLSFLGDPAQSPVLSPQLWAPSTFHMGAQRVLAPASAPLPSLPLALTLGNQMRQRQQPQQRRAALFEAVPPECAHRFHCLHLPCLAAAVTSCASSLC